MFCASHVVYRLTPGRTLRVTYNCTRCSLQFMTCTKIFPLVGHDSPRVPTACLCRGDVCRRYTKVHRGLPSDGARLVHAYMDTHSMYTYCAWHADVTRIPDALPLTRLSKYYNRERHILTQRQIYKAKYIGCPPLFSAGFVKTTKSS